jgi:hypothetical protein
MEDYLKASGDASTRTRAVLALIIIASIVTGVAIRNSMQSSWMMHRVSEMASPGLSADDCPSPMSNPSPDTPYLKDYIGCFPTASGCAGACASGETSRRHFYEVRYDHMIEAMTQAVVETRFIVHVPILGVALDVNDLGYFSGVAMTILLIWFLFSLRTERRTLTLSFDEAEQRGILASFYKLLAMRQVMTLPPWPVEVRPPFLPRKMFGVFPFNVASGRYWGPKLLTLFPLGVYVWLFVHDYWTSFIARRLEAQLVPLLICEVLFCLWILYLTFQIFGILTEIDELWSHYGAKLDVASGVPGSATNPPDHPRGKI